MFHVVLFEPEIPPNTGNIIRLCANTGSALHLIHPLGFELDDKRLRRAGLDYRDLTLVENYPNLDRFLAQVQPKRLFGLSTKGRNSYAEVAYRPGDALLFGPETRGLPIELLHSLAAVNVLRIPMLASNRSMNLSNAVAVVLYEAWRQNGFEGTES